MEISIYVLATILLTNYLSNCTRILEIHNKVSHQITISYDNLVLFTFLSLKNHYLSITIAFRRQYIPLIELHTHDIVPVQYTVAALLTLLPRPQRRQPWKSYQQYSSNLICGMQQQCYCHNFHGCSRNSLWKLQQKYFNSPILVSGRSAIATTFMTAVETVMESRSNSTSSPILIFSSHPSITT